MRPSGQRPEGRIGGGGGTAVPSLSRRAGLCLHPSSKADEWDAGRVIRTRPSWFRSWGRLRRSRISASPWVSTRQGELASFHRSALPRYFR